MAFDFSGGFGRRAAPHPLATFKSLIAQAHPQMNRWRMDLPPGILHGSAHGYQRPVGGGEEGAGGYSPAPSYPHPYQRPVGGREEGAGGYSPYPTFNAGRSFDPMEGIGAAPPPPAVHEISPDLIARLQALAGAFAHNRQPLGPGGPSVPPMGWSQVEPIAPWAAGRQQFRPPKRFWT